MRDATEQAEGTSPPPAQPAPEDTARAAGRGGVAVAGAKVYFMLIGFVQQSLLTWVLGDVGYGTFSRVSAIANVANNVVITSSIQGASRAVAQAQPGEEPGTQRGVLSLHLKLALPLAALFAVCGPAVALLTNARHLVKHLLVASVVVFGYAIYAPLVGTLNGRRRFGWQALLDTTYATVRTLALLAGGLLLSRQGAGPLGSIAGIALAALVIIPIAARVAGVGRAGPGAPETSAYLRFMAPLALGQLFLNALMQSDIWLLGMFASRSAEAAGLVGAEVSRAADRSAAIYKACQLFSFLPYQLLLSITFILFPLLAKADHDGDRAAVATYVRTGMRLACILAGGMVAVVFGLAPHLLRLTFPPAIAEPGGSTLRVLALGQGAFALYGIATTILSSLHKERWTMGLNAASTLLLVGTSFLLVPGSAPGAPIAERAALATSIALACAVLAGCLAVYRHAGALVAPLSAARVAVAFVATAAVARVLPVHGKVMTLVAAAALGVVYLATLVVTRELGGDDVAVIKRVLGRKKG